MATNKYVPTGRPRGRPVGSVTVVGDDHLSWVGPLENKELLLHWIAAGLPRRVIVEHCKEAGIELPQTPGITGTPIGQQMGTLRGFAKEHKDEITALREVIRLNASADAQQKREDFLAHCYTTRDMLYEEMMTDRDLGGRAHLVREHTNVCNLIADIEGFKRPNYDARERHALDLLVEHMYGKKDEASIVDAEIKVLPAPQLPAGE